MMHGIKNVWKHINKLRGVELRTLSKRNPFKIVFVDEYQIIVRPLEGTGDRPIKKAIFESVYQRLMEKGRIDLSEIRSFIEFSPVYVMAILETLPRVQKQKEGRKTILKVLNDISFLKSEDLYPDEIENSNDLFEGAKCKIVVNSYERNRKAREECIAEHGCNCSICEMSFLGDYGAMGAGFIHVHHIVELSKIGKEYKVDGKRDMIPVCPNCHAMLHHGKGEVGIEELKMIVKRLKSSS